MNKPDKIVYEVACDEFERFLEAMGLEYDIEQFDQEDLKAFESTKNKLIKCIQKGSLTINDKGEPVYTQQRVKEGQEAIVFTFYEPDGHVLSSSDRIKKDREYNRIFTIMGHLTKQNPTLFNKLKVIDLNVCQHITTLFLGW